MKKYFNLIEEIMVLGKDKQNRTGVISRSIFGTYMRMNLEQGFPLLTTKKMFFRGIVEELLFFLRGSTNTKELEEKGIKIWKGNTSREFLDKKGLCDYPEGEMGPGYGFQWCNWGGDYHPISQDLPVMKSNDGIDQLDRVVETLRRDPNDRRMLVCAWNVSQLHKMALPPCHVLFQFYSHNKRLSCAFFMRSIDVALGLPFNIASYALLTHFIASITSHKVGDLIFMGGDTHIYHSHFEGIKEQMKRNPFPLPRIKFDLPRDLRDIEKMRFEDFALEGYRHHGRIKMPMSI